MASVYYSGRYYTEAQLLAWPRVEVEMFRTHREAARKWGISEQWLSDILRGKRDIGPKLLKQIEWRKAVMYTPVPKVGARGD